MIADCHTHQLATVVKTFLLLFAVLLNPAAAHVEEVEVLRHGNLSVVLVYPESATLADKEWLSIVFRNSGSEKVEIADASYRMEKEVWVGGQLHSTGSLASGNTYDLFPHCWKETPIAPRFVEPGFYAVNRHPSRYCSALLTSPKDGDFEVKASLHLDLTLPDGTRISSPQKGIPFSFRWEKPDAEGLAAIEKEILTMLDNPEPESASVHGYRLTTLLKAGTFPSLTPDRLLRAIDRRRDDPWCGRKELIQLYLDTTDDFGPLQDYYWDHMPEGWDSLFDDIAFFTDALWRDDFLSPLVKVATSKHHPRQDKAFWLLSRLWKKWHKHPEIPSALAQSTIQKWERLEGKSEEKVAHDNDLYAVNFYIRELGECRDQKLIPILLPYLKWESRHITEDKIRWSIPVHDFKSGADDIILPPTFRIRDEAIYAILTIQYGDPKHGLVDLGYHKLVPQRNGSIWHIKEEDLWRNVIIQKIIDAAE